MEPNKLTTATSQEIEEAYADISTRKVPPRECKYCGVIFTPANKWQSFCKPKHRTAYHNEADARRIEYLENQLAQAHRDMEEMRRELFRAEKMIRELEARLL